MDSEQMMQGAPQDPSAGGMPPVGPQAGPPMGGMPGMGDAQDPSQMPITPEQHQELVGLLDSVKQGFAKWNSVKFSMQNKVDAARMDELKKVFQLLMENGVDLRDPQSISSFFAQLKQQAPEIYPAIQNALDYLLGSDNEQPQPTQEAGDQLQAGPEEAPQEGAV